MSAALPFLLCSVAFGLGHVVELTDETFHTVLGETHPPAFVNLMAPWCDHCKVLKPELEDVAWAFSKYPSEPVIIASFDADLHREISSPFEIERYPMLVWFPKDSNTHQVYTGERTSEAIIKFINSMTGLNAKRFRRRGRIVHVDEKSFDSIVLDPARDVFVEFYAPWCGHCKQILPVFETLAEVFADEPDVVIALVDADKYRDLGAAHRVLGYPTLKFYSKTNKGGEDYLGGRDPDTVVRFLNERCGKSRASRGRFEGHVGRVEQLDIMAEDFISADATEQKAILESVLSSPHPEASEYAAAMRNILDNPQYVSAELARLERIIEYDRVTPSKVSQLSRRINVLSAFVAAEGPQDDGIVIS